VQTVINLFDDLSPQSDEESHTELLRRKGVRIERIVSTGQSTPVDKPYNQDYDEWVLLVSGSAGLWIAALSSHLVWNQYRAQSGAEHRITTFPKCDPVSR
jgi:cupin 2 domain-containing protein